MSKRLQVLIDETEFEQYQRLAAAEHLTVAEWVRQALRLARERRPARGPSTKLAALDRAAEYRFPTADIDQMAAEIETGYLE